MGDLKWRVNIVLSHSRHITSRWQTISKQGIESMRNHPCCWDTMKHIAIPGPRLRGRSDYHEDPISILAQSRYREMTELCQVAISKWMLFLLNLKHVMYGDRHLLHWCSTCVASFVYREFPKLCTWSVLGMFFSSPDEQNMFTSTFINQFPRLNMFTQSIS